MSSRKRASAAQGEESSGDEISWDGNDYNEDCEEERAGEGLAGLTAGAKKHKRIVDGVEDEEPLPFSRGEICSSPPKTTIAPHTQGVSGTLVDITRGPDVGTLNQASKLLKDYFRQQNRPFNALQLFENFHKRISKGLIDQALEDRHLDKLGLKVKVFGKAKIYFPDQSKMPSHGCSRELEQQDREIARLEQCVFSLQKRERQSLAIASSLNKEPRDSDIDAKLAEIESRVRSKTTKVAQVAGSVVDPMVLIQVTQEHNFYRKEWATRKRIATELIPDLASGLEKKLKDVISEIGLETDEEAGVVLPLLLPEIR